MDVRTVLSDQLVSVRWAWRSGEVPPFQLDPRGQGMGGFADRVAEDAFVWRQGRSEVSLERDGNAWRVVYTSNGRLLGPRQVLHDARHRRANHAAWDVMARVIRASRDEEEGLRVATRAAQWMRGIGIPDETDD